VIAQRGKRGRTAFGLTPDIAERMKASGGTCHHDRPITSGRSGKFTRFFRTSDTLLRPENYPVISGAGAIPGKDIASSRVRDIPVLVYQSRGRVKPVPLRDPMQVGKALLKQFRSKVKAAIVDSTPNRWTRRRRSRSSSTARSPRSSARTRTCRRRTSGIMPGGTAYYHRYRDDGSRRQRHWHEKGNRDQPQPPQMPLKLEVQNSPAEIQGVLISIDTATGKAISIERVRQLSAV